MHQSRLPEMLEIPIGQPSSFLSDISPEGHRPTTEAAMSRSGGRPNNRRYSRLNWDGLSYPTLNATLAASGVSMLRILRASCSSHPVSETATDSYWLPDSSLMSRIVRFVKYFIDDGRL